MRSEKEVNFILPKVGEGRVAKVADFGLTRDVYIDEAYWKRSSGKCNQYFLSKDD